MSSKRPDHSLLSLWDHQRSAISTIEEYFSATTKRACLVHMPTGTGKTGVMAVAASQRTDEAAVLIVCPSAALVSQLLLELKDRVWQTLNADDTWKPELVLHLLPSAVDDLVAEIEAQKKRTILVGTIQALQKIHSDEASHKLKPLVGTIFFDEGHREPATLWADAVRYFEVPTILFSATPYRSDMKLFDVDEEHVNFLSFQTAVADRLIRPVEFDGHSLSGSISEFAEQVIAERDKRVSDGTYTANNKMIVRAASEDSVADLFDAFCGALDGRPEGVLAVHNNFDNETAGKHSKLSTVPETLRDRNEVFLIHQFMLSEGLDDPSITMLAFFEPFENERMLVQQVGRLTRHPGTIGDTVPAARVLFREVDEVEKMWSRFLSYDRACLENGGKPPIRNDFRVLEGIVSALPEIDYIGGQFRQKIDLKASDFSDELVVPKSALVYEIHEGFDVHDFKDAISKQLLEEDRFEYQNGLVADDTCGYHVSLKLTQSPYLMESLFQVASLEVTIYSIQGDRLFFYDTSGAWPDDPPNLGARLSPLRLRPLLPAGDESIISQLSVKNSDLGPLAVRSRSIAARSLQRSGVFLGEHMNVVTQASGRVVDRRRSIGFSRSRVRETTGPSVTIPEFHKWCEGINKELDDGASPNPVLGRFAVPIDIPPQTEPKNILVDMQELEGEFKNKSDTTAEFDLENLCVDVELDGNPNAPAPHFFRITVDGEENKVWIKWDPKKKKYWLKSIGLSGIKSKDNERISLTRRLNQLQPFRVITSDLKCVYVHGAFYDLGLNLSDSTSPGRIVLDLISPVPELLELDSEKGKPVGSLATWPEGSLFRFIDDELAEGRTDGAFGRSFKALVCDDLGTEAADFIGVDSATEPSSRAVFVVAKHKKGNKDGDAGVSPSSFYDVSAQGIKNLAYLKSDGMQIPGSERKWDNDWKTSRGEGAAKEKANIPRKRYGPASRGFRTQFERVKTIPSSNREIWLVCSGGMLSKSALEDELSQKTVKPHVLQFYHLLLSAYASCQSVGVSLKVFCAK